MKLYAVAVRWVASVLVLLLLSGSAWLLLGDAGAAWARGRIDQPQTARLIPAQAPVMVSLLNPTEQLESLLQPTSPSIRGSAVELAQLPARLLNSVGLNYQTDIQPWVTDEITFAINSLEAPSYLLAFATNGKRSSQDCLEALWQQQVATEQSLTFEQHNGVDIISTQFASPSDSISTAGFSLDVPTLKSLATAVVDEHFVLVANSAAVLRQVVDGLDNPELQLASTTDYQQALDQLEHPQRKGIIFVNLAAIWPPTGEATAAPMPRYRSLALNLGTVNQGLSVETVLVVAPDQAITAVPPTQTQPVQALDYVPTQSPLVLASTNLEQLWTQIHEDVQGYAVLSDWVDRTLTAWGGPWQLDLVKEVFPWVEGEYAVALMPDRSGLSPVSTSTPDWVFVHEQDTEDLQNPLMLNLVRHAKAQGIGLIPYPRDPQTKLSAWVRPSPSTLSTPSGPSGKTTLNVEILGASTRIDPHQITVTSFAALDPVLAAPTNGLVQQSAFKAAISSFAQPNQGYLYMDWPMLRPVLEQQLPFLRSLEQAVPILFDQLQTVVATGYGETPEAQRSQLMFRYASPEDDIN